MIDNEAVEDTVGSDLYRALKRVGFPLPEECGDVLLEMRADGLMQLKYSIFVWGEQLVKLSQALRIVGEWQHLKSSNDPPKSRFNEIVRVLSPPKETTR